MGPTGFKDVLDRPQYTMVKRMRLKKPTPRQKVGAMLMMSSSLAIVFMRGYIAFVALSAVLLLGIVLACSRK
jgi:hypothetical protein